MIMPTELLVKKQVNLKTATVIKTSNWLFYYHIKRNEYIPIKKPALIFFFPVVKLSFIQVPHYLKDSLKSHQVNNLGNGNPDRVLRPYQP